MNLTQAKKLYNIIDTVRNLSGILHSDLRAIETSAILDNSGTSYTPEYFSIEEWVPREIASRYGKKAFMFLDTRILWTGDSFREYFNKPIFVNNYKFNGNLQYRGFRPPDVSVGASLSQHRFGRALDFEVSGISANEVRQEITSHPSEVAFQYIKRMEKDTPTWTHVDCANTLQDEIILFNP